MEHSEEILYVKWREYSSQSWTRSVLSHDQTINWAKAKVCVYADSVPCLRQMNESKEAKARWEGQVEGLKLYPSYQEAVGIDGEAIEFEWNVFPGFSSLSILQEIQKELGRKKSGMEVLPTLKKENGILQPKNGTVFQRNWETLFVGSWRRRRVKIPYTSMDIQQTQNSYSKQFIL